MYVQVHYIYFFKVHDRNRIFGQTMLDVMVLIALHKIIFLFCARLLSVTRCLVFGLIHHLE